MPDRLQAVAISGCSSRTELREARRLASEIQVSLAQMAPATNRAVMAHDDATAGAAMDDAKQAGLLVARVDQPVVEELWAYLLANPGAELTVSLEEKTITAGEAVHPFDIDDYTRHRLLNGLDDIGVTLQSADAIDAYEAKRPGWKVTTLPARTAG